MDRKGGERRDAREGMRGKAREQLRLSGSRSIIAGKSITPRKGLPAE